ncbi:OprD family porin [Pseudomonas sp. JAI111]|nr:OprD family porin [Pseudomonas sp. JAI111]
MITDVIPICSASRCSATLPAPQERVWIARYDFDFATTGLPGLRA